jgi:hypothetical protein
MERRAIGISIREQTPEETARSHTETLADIEAHFKASLESAEGALTVSYLDDDDRSAIESAIHGIKGWLPVFLKSDDPGFVRQAGLRLAAYNKRIGACCEVSDSGAKYWEIKKRGGPRKRLSKASKDAQAWQNYVRFNLPEMVRSNPDHTPKERAEEFMLDESAPKSLPKSVDYLTKFIRR